MIIHAGTGWFCLVFFISRFLRDVFLRAAMYVSWMFFIRLLSVGLFPHPEERIHYRKGKSRRYEGKFAQ
jgi:hypothetical protein